MPEKARLATLSVITDDDTGVYKVGEIDGGFNTTLLEHHVRKYGSSELLAKLATMAGQVAVMAASVRLEDTAAKMKPASITK